MANCSKCDDTGWITKTETTKKGDVISYSVTCPDCAVGRDQARK